MTSISCDICGGLGNQLFIIFACIGTASLQNKKYLISKDQQSTFPRPTYFNELLPKLNYCNIDDIKPAFTFKEKNHNFYSEIPNIEKDLKITGYFQSSKYFDHISNFVRESFILRNLDQKIVDNKLNNLKQKYSNLPLIWIHIRRTDYVSLSNYHLNLKLDYYKEAITHFPKESIFIVFSDDIRWCKDNLDFIENKEFISDVDYRELILMSKLDGGIMANSTFSWWAAWLMDPEKNKIIVTPNRWFASRGDEIIQKDRIESHWKVLDVPIN